MQDTLVTTFGQILAAYGVFITLVVLLVVGGVVGVVFFIRSWIERAAHQRLDKELESYRAELNSSLETHRARLSAAADSARAEYQRRLQELNLYSVDRHKAYARTFRRLLVAEGELGSLAGTSGFGLGDYTDATRAELEELLAEREVPRPVLRSAIDAWERDRNTKEIDDALYGARLLRAERRQQEFRNTQLANDLYFSPEVRIALESAHMALADLWAYVRFPERGEGVQRLKKRDKVQEAVTTVRDRMQFDLEARNELVPDSTAEPSGV